MRTDQHKASSQLKMGGLCRGIVRGGIGNVDPRKIVLEARKYTVQAVKILASIMEGECGLDKQGVPVEVPAAVRIRAAELLIERGFGKSPQAIVLRDESSNQLGGLHSIPIAERIAALKAAKEQQGQTLDLEASQQDDPIITDLPPTPQDAVPVTPVVPVTTYAVGNTKEIVTVTPMSFPRTIIQPEDLI